MPVSNGADIRRCAQIKTKIFPSELGRYKVGSFSTHVWDSCARSRSGRKCEPVRARPAVLCSAAQPEMKETRLGRPGLFGRFEMTSAGQSKGKTEGRST